MGDMDSLRSNSRRQFIEYFAGIGLSSTLLPGVLWADMQQLKTQKITKEMLKNAEEIAGLNFTEAQREMMLAGVNQNLHMYDELRQVHLDVSVEPAVRFSPILPGMRFDTERHAFRSERRFFTDASSGFASTRILAGDAFIEIDSISSAFFTGADQALSRQAEEIQPSAQMRGHHYRKVGTGTSKTSR